ncbi:hypothetical protein CEQ90_13400 [Lewinellaceae bacterium SD302]|nr:hypothetical protein CEQ90_13400 [Lewinellaceae bacterium SD302]
MLQFFRSTQFYSSFALIFYALLLRLPAWWIPTGELNGRDTGAGVWGRAYLEWGASTPALNVLLPTLLIFLTALLANHVITNHRMSEKPSQLAGLFIILISSVSPALLGVHSLQPANFFLLLALGSVFTIYQSSKTKMAVFNAGFWLGIAVLFNAYYLIFLLLLFIAGLQLNSLSGKMLLRFTIGCLLPLFIVGTYYFWYDKLEAFHEAQFGNFFYPLPSREAIWNLGGFCFLLTALSFSLFRQFANVKMLVIAGRKKVSIIYSWLLLSGLCLLLHGAFDFASAQLMVVPLGILLSLSFARGKSATGEAAHLVMLVIALALCCYPILIR